MKIEGSESGSISQRHGSADPDPDPHQNVMDPHSATLHFGRLDPYSEYGSGSRSRRAKMTLKS
jgi:hypothetical protein